MKKLLMGLAIALFANLLHAQLINCTGKHPLAQQICADKQLSYMNMIAGQNHKNIKALGLNADQKKSYSEASERFLQGLNRNFIQVHIGFAYSDFMDKQCEIVSKIVSDRRPLCTNNIEAISAYQAQEKAAEVSVVTARVDPTKTDQRLKSLGLSQEFANAKLMINYLGQWTELGTGNEVVKSLLENRNIETIRKTTSSGYQGFSIKAERKPEFYVVFRMEGREAFIYGYGNGEGLRAINSPADHSTMATILRVYASGAALP